MDVKERIEICLLLEKIARQKNFSTKIGVADNSKTKEQKTETKDEKGR